jgi:hypothetical protein
MMKKISDIAADIIIGAMFVPVFIPFWAYVGVQKLRGKL